MSPYLRTLVIFAVVVLMMKQTICQSDIDYFPYKTKRIAANKYCGANLSNTLMLVCNGVYNTMFKKSIGPVNSDDYQYYDGPPFRSRQNANDLLSRLGLRRLRRQDQTNGIYNECCLKSCTIQELFSYCAGRS